jgi:hypothetical protein
MFICTLSPEEGLRDCHVDCTQSCDMQALVRDQSFMYTRGKKYMTKISQNYFQPVMLLNVDE